MSDAVQLHRRQPTRLPRPWDSPGKNIGVGCCFLLQCMKVKSESEVAQSCPTHGLKPTRLLHPWGLGWPNPICWSWCWFWSLCWIWIQTDTEAEAPVLWPPDAKSWLIGKDPDAGKDWGQEEKGTTEDEMVGWHHQLDAHEFEKTLSVGDGQGSLACCSPWGCKELDMTEWLNWAESNMTGVLTRD